MYYAARETGAPLREFQRGEQETSSRFPTLSIFRGTRAIQRRERGLQGHVLLSLSKSQGAGARLRDESRGETLQRFKAAISQPCYVD